MSRVRFLLLLVPPIVLAGCSRVDRLPTTPASNGVQLDRSASDLDAQGLGSFYPMAVGNRWRYAGFQTKVFISFNGDTTARKYGEGKTEVVQVRFEQMGGRTYMREEIGIPDTVLLGGGVRWRREDRTGLYELGTTPPDAPPFSETRLLAYPLHVGTKWAMVESSRLKITATVEGMDVLNLPAGRFPAWRIHVSGGTPEYTVWYGRAGYLALKQHLDTGPPPDARHIRIISDRVDSLTSLVLVRPRP